MAMPKNYYGSKLMQVSDPMMKTYTNGAKFNSFDGQWKNPDGSRVMSDGRVVTDPNQVLRYNLVQNKGDYPVWNAKDGVWQGPDGSKTMGYGPTWINPDGKRTSNFDNGAVITDKNQ